MRSSKTMHVLPVVPWPIARTIAPGASRRAQSASPAQARPHTAVIGLASGGRGCFSRGARAGRTGALHTTGALLLRAVGLTEQHPLLALREKAHGAPLRRARLRAAPRHRRGH